MDDPITDKVWKDMKDFKIVCNKCQKAGKDHHTRIFIDWETRGYLISCDECDTTVYFDEEGNPRKAEFEKIEEEEKLVN